MLTRQTPRHAGPMPAPSQINALLVFAGLAYPTYLSARAIVTQQSYIKLNWPANHLVPFVC